MPNNQYANLCLAIEDSINNNTFLKASIGGKKENNSTLNRVSIKCIKIKNEIKYSFIYKHTTNEITKNYNAKEALQEIKLLLENTFTNIDCFASHATYQYQSTNEKTTFKTKKIENASATLTHNKVKERLINNTVYLKGLGICGSNGEVLASMQHKYKQINRYIEIVADVIKHKNLPNNAVIVDMGSGKGYLTFALAEYIKSQAINASIIGVEVRKDLVDKCNAIAEQCRYAHLKFEQGTIDSFVAKQVDMLIALHACDTATDDALLKAIATNAAIIIVAPCCHKQVRNNTNKKQLAYYKHGILLERQAELITDALRAVWLESKGYATQVMEFVNVNDTPKNIMIVATKQAKSEAEKIKAIQTFEEIKSTFGLSAHYLELP
jgi:protein-L-isoaspartate O-methyltransferase